MIRNEDELALARLRLALLEDELAILRCDLLPQERRSHELMCEYFDARIQEVQREIDAYLASRARRAAEGEAAPDLSALEPAYGGLGEA